MVIRGGKKWSNYQPRIEFLKTTSNKKITERIEIIIHIIFRVRFFLEEQNKPNTRVKVGIA
jgi:hypothetical protein